MIFGKSKTPVAVTCEQLVAEFGSLLERDPFGRNPLPHDVELIKASLIATACRNETEQAIEAARAGFVALNAWIGKAKKLNLAEISEDTVHSVLDAEMDTLELEFEKRMTLYRSFANA